MFTVLMLIPVLNYGQSNEEIMNYLENTVKHNYQYVDNRAFSQISDMKLIEARIEVNFTNDEYGGTVISNYLIKNSAELKKIPSPGVLIEMPEFYQSIKNTFQLKTPEDGLVLQTALNVISQEERNEGFFSIGNKWYFIRSAFFGSYYIVETDNDGKITKIKHTKGIETDIPEEVHYHSEVKSYPDLVTPEIDKNTKEQIGKFLIANLEARFEIEEGVYSLIGGKSEFFNKISAAKLYGVKYIVAEQQGDEKYESVYHTNLITYREKIASADKIWETDLFLESTKPIFKLKTDADATLFVDFLNEAEGKTEDLDELRFYKKGDLWLFVRQKNFDEEYGYIVKTDEKGNIERLMQSGFTEADILRFRMQDPEFKVDFGFVLKNPTETTFNYNQAELFNAAAEGGDYEYINVKIEFNAQAVNAIGAWILTRQNGENLGMLASTEMTSPFTDDIPVSELEKGNHKVEYLLLRPGQETDNPLGIIILNINIE
ncbi:MAG TPA: hypothetical protein PLM49_00195 [Bacteroidales bacterium]|nr:hypothetical protein [Bacteroidales bacterium]